MRKALTPMLLCFPLTILGCAGDVAEIKWDAPLVVEMAGVSCPEIDAKTRAEFARTTPRPQPDTTDAATGKVAVSKGATQAWIDQLEIAEQRKNRAGRAVVAEHDRCRGTDAPPKPLG